MIMYWEFVRTKYSKQPHTSIFIIVEVSQNVSRQDEWVDWSSFENESHLELLKKFERAEKTYFFQYDPSIGSFYVQIEAAWINLPEEKSKSWTALEKIWVS